MKKSKVLITYHNDNTVKNACPIKKSVTVMRCLHVVKGTTPPPFGGPPLHAVKETTPSASRPPLHTVKGNRGTDTRRHVSVLAALRPTFCHQPARSGPGLSINLVNSWIDAPVDDKIFDMLLVDGQRG